MSHPSYDPRDERPLPLTSRLTYPAFDPLSAAVTAEIVARTHPGTSPLNEDHFLVVRLGRDQETIATSLPNNAVPEHFRESGYGMVVADGMGVIGVGEIASRLAISTLAHLVLHYGKWNLRIDPQAAEDVMLRAARFYRRVDERVTETGIEFGGLEGMGTTLTAAYSAGDTLFIAHVGHSRVYILRNELLTQLTRDQTMARRLADTGRPAPTELAAHDLRHILTDAIGGMAGSARVDINQFRLKDRDCVMLCTNGLTDVADDEQIADVLRQPAPVERRCQALIDLAVARGATDNITVVIAQYSVPAAPTAG